MTDAGLGDTSSAPDAFSLARFELAQNEGGIYERAVAELRAGRKSSHWMWFVFPQFAGLGHSPMSRTYAISSLSEAEAYLRHPVLGARLLECVAILTEHAGRSAQDIFGAVDSIKLRSSMTLFARAAPQHSLFAEVLELYFDGIADSATERLLRYR
jgi:uncharacterized protein (DUF1810 family)